MCGGGEKGPTGDVDPASCPVVLKWGDRTVNKQVDGCKEKRIWNPPSLSARSAERYPCSVPTQRNANLGSDCAGFALLSVSAKG
jgi:hypothetical protein